MLHKAKKTAGRILASLLAFTVTLTLLPDLSGNNNVQAATTKTAGNTMLCTSGMAKPSKPAYDESGWSGSYVYFGVYEGESINFRVLTPGTSAYGGNTMFLYSDAAILEHTFDEDSSNWNGSDIQTYLNGGFLTTAFTQAEIDAIAPSKIGSHEYVTGSAPGQVDPDTKTDYGSFVGLNGDKVFLLDAEEVSNTDYGFLTDYSRCYARAYGSSEYKRLLRSTYVTNTGYVGAIGSGGRFTFVLQGAGNAVAPALNIDLSSVIFSTAVSGSIGKAGTKYKLTLKDTNLGISLPENTQAVAENGIVTVPYEITGDADRVSVLILDKEYTERNTNNANILYYGEINGSTKQFTLPNTLLFKDWGTGYFVYILAEDINGDYYSDYASEPYKLEIPDYTLMTFDISVTSGSSDRSSAELGETITVTADPAGDGYIFDKWEVTSGNASLANPYFASTTFIMPAEAVNLKATYKETSPGDNNISLGTSGIASPVAPASTDSPWTGSYVYFGKQNGNPLKFRVLSPFTTEYGSSTMFLDCDSVLYWSAFDATTNKWEYSGIRSGLNGDFLDKSFTSAENSAIAYSTKGYEELNVGTGPGCVTNFTFQRYLFTSPLYSDKIFLLDLAEMQNTLYGYYPSDDNYMCRIKNGQTHFSWLRSSPATSGYGNVVARIGSGGSLSFWDSNTSFQISPALNISLSSVIFTNLIDGEFGATGSVYKLTVKDQDISISIPDGGKASLSGNTVTIPYQVTGANANNVNRVSLLVLDKNYTEGNTNGASILYYAEVDSSSGKVSLPDSLDTSKWGTDFYVYILAEDINGEKETNYASAPCLVGSPEGYTVIFDNGGIGTAPAPQTLAEGETVTEPDVPVTDGNKLVGWYVDEGLTEKYDFTAPVTADITLHAKWISLDYTVTVNYGSADTSMANAGDVITVTADTSDTGKAFVYWEANEGTVEFDDNTDAVTTFTMPAEDVEITAIFRYLDRTVTFDANGHGTAPEAQQIIYAGKAVQPDDPSAEGYIFGGWYTDAECTEEYDFNSYVLENTTLYARWTADPDYQFPEEPEEDEPEAPVTPETTPEEDEPEAPVTPETTPEEVSEPEEIPSAVLLVGAKGHIQDIGDVTVSVDPATGIMTLGTTGQSKRLEEIVIDFENTTGLSGTMEYRVHVQDYGWLPWTEAGNPAGTTGESKRIEAIEIRLTGELAEYYSVEYCVHIQDYGDMQGWVSDGALAGTTGESKRIEQIKVRVVPKGTGDSMSVKYRVHIQDIGWESSWAENGEMSGTQGQAKRLEGISIELYGEVAEYYDIYYRVHAQDIGWMGWAKNGEYAGTAGRSARLEGIQIVLVPKGSAAPGDTYEGVTAATTVPFIEGF